MKSSDGELLALLKRVRAQLEEDDERDPLLSVERRVLIRLLDVEIVERRGTVG